MGPEPRPPSRWPSGRSVGIALRLAVMVALAAMVAWPEHFAVATITTCVSDYDGDGTCDGGALCVSRGVETVQGSGVSKFTVVAHPKTTRCRLLRRDSSFSAILGKYR